MWEIPVLLLIYVLLNYFLPKRTTEQGGGIQSSESEKIGKASTEEKKQRTKVDQTEKGLTEVTKRKRKVPLLEYTVLREHRVEMIKELVPQKAISCLKQNNVFDQDDVEKIEKKCQDLKRKSAETMLYVLRKSESWSFKKLIAALQQAGYHTMAQKLTGDLEKRTTENVDGIHPNKTGSTGNVSPEEETGRAKVEQIKHRLAANLPSEYAHQRLDKEYEDFTDDDGILLYPVSGFEDLIDNDVYKIQLQKLRYYSNEFWNTLRQERRTTREEEIHISGMSKCKSPDDLCFELSLRRDSDFKQRNKERERVNQKVSPEETKRRRKVEHLGYKEAGYDDLWPELDSDSKQKILDYSHSPQLQLGHSAVNWSQKIAIWKEDDAGQSWCVAMNDWFKKHEFENGVVFKIVVKNWLLKLEEVVDRGCLDLDKINVILDVTKAFLNLDSNNSNFEHDKFIFEDNLNYFVPDFLTTEDKGEFVESKKAEKQRLLEQQRRVVKKLKHNLYGIIEGKQSFNLLPIDTESCELAGYFNSVVDDVREIWNKLH